MSSIQEILLKVKEENPELFQRIIKFSEQSRDAGLGSFERLVACYELSTICSSLILESFKMDFERMETKKIQGPQYKWVNGAKVRVKGT